MKAKILGLTAAGLLAGPMAANASLVGDQIGCAITPTPLWICTSSTATVGAGQEFELEIPAAPNDFGLGVDVGASSIRISSIEDNGFGLGAGELLTLTGLDFSTGGTIVGVANFIQSGVTLSPNSLSFTANSVSIDLQSFWAVGSFLSFDLVTAAVPEPATLALLGLGLAGAGFSVARRRRAN